ncbi:TrmH family RNA methyltransferase, partial [Acinetobacter baumannii]
MRRAGLDYHEYATMQVHPNWPAFLEKANPDPTRCFALTTKGSQPFAQVRFEPGDWLFFGAETRGLSESIRNWFAETQ